MKQIVFGLLGTIGVILLAGCGKQEEVQPAPVVISSPIQAERPAAAEPAVQVAELSTPASVESKLPIYELRMKPQDLSMMERNPYGEQLYPATFSSAGEVYEDVKIRFRGAWGRTWPKKPLKIFLNEAKPFEGQRRLNLNSSFRDPSFIRETLAYRIYEAAGAPASRSQLVRVQMNGEFRGVYVQVEQPDKAMMKRLGLKGATVIKASSRMKQSDERDLGEPSDYRMHYEQETQKDQDGLAELDRFCTELAQTGNALQFFEKHVDVDRYINYLAATAFCQNWDGYNKNHFLVYDGAGSKKWLVLPWDLDRALGDYWDWSFGRADLPIDLGTRARPGTTGWNRMMDRFFSDPDLSQRFAERLQHLVENELTLAKLEPWIEQTAMAIAADAALDYRRWPNPGTPWYRNDEVPVAQSIAIVKRYIEDRRAFILRELPRFRR